MSESVTSEIASSYSPSMGIIPNLALPAFDTYMSEDHTTLGSYDWLQASLDLCDPSYTSQACEAEIPAVFESAAFMAASQVPDTITPISDSDGHNLHGAINASVPGRSLTSLIADMQQQSAELVEGPWHKDDACSLGDYPIGRILELSQRFSAVSGPVLRRASPASEDAMESDTDDTSNARAAGAGAAATADTPTMLLVMCGYLWLLRIYGVVLSHFQKHLHRMSPSQYSQAVSAGLAGTGMSDVGNHSGICLDELPCADDALGLQRIHVAIRMLLDLLSEVEGHLGPHGMVARDVTMTLLVNSGTCPIDSSRGLEKKVATVKKLLLQKMGL